MHTSSLFLQAISGPVGSDMCSAVAVLFPTLTCGVFGFKGLYPLRPPPSFLPPAPRSPTTHQPTTSTHSYNHQRPPRNVDQQHQLTHTTTNKHPPTTSPISLTPTTHQPTTSTRSYNRQHAPRNVHQLHQLTHTSNISCSRRPGPSWSLAGRKVMT